MGQDTTIGWTATQNQDGTWSPGCTFNPWRGCTKVSPGCAHCYAEAQSRRNPEVLGVWGPHGTRVVASDSYWRQPILWNKKARADGVRRRVFCASLADVFEGPETMPVDQWFGVEQARERLWATIWCTPSLDWLLLTKRPENVTSPKYHIWAPGATANAVGWVREMAGEEEAQRFYSGDWPPPNVWLGVSVENQQAADERIPLLLKIDARVRFLSCEPLLGPVDLRRPGWLPHPFNREPHCEHCEDCVGCPGWEDTRPDRHGPFLGWVVCGGESGPGHRPCAVEWVASLVDQCQVAGVPVFVKQAAGPKPGCHGDLPDDLWALKQFPEGVTG